MQLWSNLTLKAKLAIAMSLMAVVLTMVAVAVVQSRSAPAIRAVMVSQLEQSVATVEASQRYNDQSGLATAALMAHNPALAVALATGNDRQVKTVGHLMDQMLTPGLVYLVVDRHGRSVVEHPSAALSGAGQPPLGPDADSRVWWLVGRQLYELFREPILDTRGVEVGRLLLGRAVDQNFALHLQHLADSQVVIAARGRVLASTLSAAELHELHPANLTSIPGPHADQTLGGTAYVLQTIKVDNDLDAPTYTLLRPVAAGIVLRQTLRRLLLLLGVSVLLLGAALAFLVARAVSQPLQRLLAGVRALENGDFDYPLPPASADEVGQLAAGFARMRATLQRTRQGLVRAARIEALGQMAGGVAHDFNNLITVINGFSELMLAKLGPSDPNRRYLTQIHNAGDRAASVTRQLLLFSRHGLSEPRALEVNEAVGGMEAMLSLLLGESIAFSVHPSAGPAHIFLDPSYLERVIINLVTNARDAMPDGGALTIAVSVVESRGTPELAGLPPGRYVQLSVEDTGVGMDAETQKHLFEPFFTTKEVGKGTGLGLATVYGIVNQAGGVILVTSEPGRGARFRVLLPEHEHVAEAPAPAAAEPEPLARGEGTVLLAEDEEGLRGMAREALESAGYHVLAAADGAQALELASQQGRPLDLLFTDVVMPRMGGRELAANLRQRQPGLPILFTSGYTERAAGEMGEAMDFAADSHFLPKPFTPTALLRKIDEMLHPVAGSAGA